MSISLEDRKILYSIQWQNKGGQPTQIARLAVNAPIYSIDLSTRTIQAPEFLGVQDDHQSDRIYFLVDRFFDNMDLSHTICLIQYKTPKKEEALYVVPFYDVYTYAQDGKILFPWTIAGHATEAPGVIEFSVKFFKMSAGATAEESELFFELNTLPAKSRVLPGLEPGLAHADYGVDSEGNAINKVLLDSQLWERLEEIVSESGKWQIYWNEV